MSPRRFGLLGVVRVGYAFPWPFVLEGLLAGAMNWVLSEGKEGTGEGVGKDALAASFQGAT